VGPTLYDLMRQQFDGTFGAAVDWLAFVAFLGVSGVLFVAAALGCRFRRRRFVVLSLWLLVATLAVSLVPVLRDYRRFLERPGPDVEGWMHWHFAAQVVKMVLFVASLASFVVGLQSLQPCEVAGGGRSDAEPVNGLPCQ
jgi:MFS family permease